MTGVVTRVVAPAGGSRLTPGRLVAVCLGVHLAAASLMLLRLGSLLHERLAASGNPGHALALERGLRCLLAAQLIVPPIVPLLVLAGVAFAVRRARHLPMVRFWLAAGLVPLAAAQVGRLAVVWLAAAPRTPGAVLALPERFSVGARPLFDLAGMAPGPVASHWLGVVTVGAVVSGLAWTHALAIAERARERPRGTLVATTAVDRWRAAGRVTAGWIAASVLAQAATPIVIPTLLSIAG